MISKIKELVDKAGLNPHWISTRTRITYRIVLGLYNSEVIPPKTGIGTLQSIASVLGVKVDDLYEVKAEG